MFRDYKEPSCPFKFPRFGGFVGAIHFLKKNNILVLFVKPSEDGASFYRFIEPSYIKRETFELKCENLKIIEKIAFLVPKTTKEHL